MECVTDEPGYYVLNNNRVIQLGGGRLVLPVAAHEFDGQRLLAGKIVVYLSDNEGLAWRRSATVLDTDAQGARVNYMEPGVVETGPNHLLMVIRTKLGCQYLSESGDRGETWGTPMPSDRLSPESPGHPGADTVDGRPAAGVERPLQPAGKLPARATAGPQAPGGRPFTRRRRDLGKRQMA